MPRFTVDTHLFRELGELLVGRDSTALIELIKNAYDADATEVIVYGEHLGSPEHGSIIVMDNGVGMTVDQFTSGFLRIASRLKDVGERRSVRYRRRYTGVKGIGRLSAHKLARVLDVDSIRAGSRGRRRESLHAVIDWDAIEQYETLDDLDSDVVVLNVGEAREGVESGTTLILSKLRRAWSKSEQARFLADVQAFDPPRFLRGLLPPAVLSKSPLFETPLVRDVKSDEDNKPGDFSVVLDGDFASGDEYWELVAEIANWVLEIRAEPGEKTVRFAITPTKKTQKGNPVAREFVTAIPHPDPDNGPFFDARVLVREGPVNARQDQRVWASKTSGIRIYLEGFRVLPYGDDDWLSIDADYTRRPRALEMLKDLNSDIEIADPDEGLTRLPGNNYFGAVFLTQERAPTLRILVNREGFVPEAGFDNLVKLVRTGVDLCTRVRAAAAYPQRQKRREERRSERVGSEHPDTEEAEIKADARGALPDLVDDSVTLIHEARTLVGEGRLDAARQAITQVERKLGDTKDRVADVISERSLLRILASVGAQMAAFVHEINALLGTAQAVEQALERTLDDSDLTRDQRKRLRATLAAAMDLKLALERHASYLMDVVTPDARRRRSRQRLAERFDGAVRLVHRQAARRRITIDNRIPVDAKSPPMFPAELTTVFANLLTNAVKAAGTDGRVCASLTEGNDRVLVRIQNTGAVVDLNGAERWFKPFESTTWEVDAVLGQGMGLGLPITRSVLANYGGTIGFVEPDGAYATAIEVAFPK